MDKPNRAERRRNKFGGGRATAHGGWPTVEPNPVFHPDTEGDGADPASPKPAETAPEKPATATEPKAAAADAEADTAAG